MRQGGVAGCAAGCVAGWGGGRGGARGYSKGMGGGRGEGGSARDEGGLALAEERPERIRADLAGEGQYDLVEEGADRLRQKQRALALSVLGVRQPHERADELEQQKLVVGIGVVLGRGQCEGR